MQTRGNSSSIHPVLTRFAVNERAFLGLIAHKKRRRKGKRVHPRWVRQLTKWSKKAAQKALTAVMVICFLGSAVWLGPKLFYSFFPSGSIFPVKALEGDFQLTVDQKAIEEEAKEAPKIENFQPPFNANLPEGDWLVIPRIGVRSVLQPTENYEDALTTGVWWAPGFGGPGDRNAPMIVAGHRFGFKWWWENDYWKYHSFYLLPNLEPGDTVEIISGKRKYLYEIYAGEEGMEVTDYTADLILYTCKHLDSPIRIFRYAKLIPPEGATPLQAVQ